MPDICSACAISRLSWRSLFALVIALPLGIWIFAPLRRRATASIAVFDERRRKDREQLQARLRGEETSSGEEPPTE